MKERPLITIIIPTLNEEKHLKSCLQSVFSQTYHSNLMEILVIDGGSIDKTIGIVKDLQKNQSNLVLIHNSKKIQAAAFNLGVEKANGELIIRLDAHCHYEKNYIHYCVLNHLEAEYGNVGGYWKVIPGSDTLMAKTIALINSSLFGLGGAAFRIGGQKKEVETVPFGAFPKSVLSIVGKMNENLVRGEDNEYNARIVKSGFKILFDPRIIAYYYSRNSLKLFLKQMKDNGFSIGVLLHNSIDSVCFRHIIPMFFVVFFTAGGLLSIPFLNIRIIFLYIMFFYFILDLFSGFYAAKREIKIIPVWLFSVFLAHFYYGIGTIAGLFKGRYGNN